MINVVFKPASITQFSTMSSCPCKIKTDEAPSQTAIVGLSQTLSCFYFCLAGRPWSLRDSCFSFSVLGLIKKHYHGFGCPDKTREML